MEEKVSGIKGCCQRHEEQPERSRPLRSIKKRVQCRFHKECPRDK